MISKTIPVRELVALQVEQFGNTPGGIGVNGARGIFGMKQLANRNVIVEIPSLLVTRRHLESGSSSSNMYVYTVYRNVFL